MTRIVIVFIILTFISCSDNPSADKSSVDQSADAIEIVCKCMDTLIVDSLKPRSPFDKVDKIISYEFKDTLVKTEPTFENIIANGKLQYKHIVKEVDITSKKLTLEKILLNKIEKCNNGTIIVADECLYMPHHCIVFYGKKGVATDFIEICFECEKTMTSKENSFGLFCGNTYCELRKLFKDAGHNIAPLRLEQCQTSNW